MINKYSKEEFIRWYALYCEEEEEDYLFNRHKDYFFKYYYIYKDVWWKDYVIWKLRQ